MSSISPDDAILEEECNVRVLVRVRPLVSKEKNNNATKCLKINKGNQSITIKIMEQKLADHKRTSTSEKKFTFDKILSEKTTQKQVFENGPKQIIDKVLQGFNGCIFCYGQTGSGKTYTMFGTKKNGGIICKASGYIQDRIKQYSKGEHKKIYELRATFIEIYNEKIIDLLVADTESSKNQRLSIRQDRHKGIYVEGIIDVAINNGNDLKEVIKYGQERRQTAATKMNEASSRSHCIMSLHFEIKQNKKDIGQHATLHFIDLAGSERAGANIGTDSNSDKILREGTNINLSLTALGCVIKALVEKKKHVPYRNSKITRLLQDSLGGDSMTIMIANLGPAQSNSAESLSTLRFANRAKEIKNKAQKYHDPVVAEMARLRLENKRLRLKIKKLQKSQKGKENTSCACAIM